MGPDQFIELSFGTVHYIYHSGSSALPLNIFVHGYSTPMEMWQYIFPEFVKDDQPCLVYDLYGPELLYALNLPYEKYNLFGVSMGGGIVQRFTELHPYKEQHPGYLRALFSTLRNFDFESSLTSIEFIAKLNIPVLIIWGDKDLLIPVNNAYHYHRLYKNSSLTIIPGATHMLLLEHSAQIIDAVQAFFKDSNVINM
ncbi:unnamed protein product [Rotaria magnacalcarata]|uniref:AB hydrolase-1 domain-containing protein n=1 Tax=Rotaria magnacalcarata TaxID=392030 RepID=A0A816MFS7_9BILA|nr:unnamed protein product [Rotaria magnacalcarata]